MLALLHFIVPPEHLRYIFHHIKKTENRKRGMRTDASRRRRRPEEREGFDEEEGR
jgi:hypothetical protein